MTDSKIMVERASRAQLLAAAGWSQADIARELGGVTTRTIRRYLTYEVPDELTLPPSEVELASRAAFIERAWPLILDLVDFVECQLKAGELKAKDAIIGAGVLIDKIRQLQPAVPVVTETEQVTFVITTRDALPGRDTEKDIG